MANRKRSAEEIAEIKTQKINRANIKREYADSAALIFETASETSGPAAGYAAVGYFWQEMVSRLLDGEKPLPTRQEIAAACGCDAVTAMAIMMAIQAHESDIFFTRGSCISGKKTKGNTTRGAERMKGTVIPINPDVLQEFENLNISDPEEIYI